MAGIARNKNRSRRTTGHRFASRSTAAAMPIKAAVDLSQIGGQVSNWWGGLTPQTRNSIIGGGIGLGGGALLGGAMGGGKGALMGGLAGAGLGAGGGYMLGQPPAPTMLNKVQNFATRPSAARGAVLGGLTAGMVAEPALNGLQQVWPGSPTPPAGATGAGSLAPATQPAPAGQPRQPSSFS